MDTVNPASGGTGPAPWGQGSEEVFADRGDIGSLTEATSPDTQHNLNIGPPVRRNRTYVHGSAMELHVDDVRDIETYKTVFIRCSQRVCYQVAAEWFRIVEPQQRLLYNTGRKPGWWPRDGVPYICTKSMSRNGEILGTRNTIDPKTKN